MIVVIVVVRVTGWRMIGVVATAAAEAEAVALPAEDEGVHRAVYRALGDARRARFAIALPVDVVVSPPARSIPPGCCRRVAVE